MKPYIFYYVIDEPDKNVFNQKINQLARGGLTVKTYTAIPQGIFIYHCALLSIFLNNEEEETAVNRVISEVITESMERTKEELNS